MVNSTFYAQFNLDDLQTEQQTLAVYGVLKPPFQEVQEAAAACRLASGATPNQKTPDRMVRGLRENRTPVLADMFLDDVSSKRVLVVLTGELSNLCDLIDDLGSCPPGRYSTSPRLPRQEQRRLTAKDVEELCARYRAGASMNVLATEFGVHRTTVADKLRRSRVALRRQGLRPEDLETAIRLRAQGWSYERLGQQFSCDAETVRQRLKPR
ncbi:hypothetical protein SAMN04515671_0650 [Nakamurella panacisegetis]|uniref:Uncharacterized protein n=1 Tax=Nakamurella panacisegetis TaxID=1090615 RepID=A0A1H0IUE7_9ACTN|nr:hypothetical protein [Nakamurella panacisegetis]SDO34953.1 hypothetical protein SAMN04515671_0650 [Nakamurella panacisegetis]